MFLNGQQVVCVDDSGLQNWIDVGLYSAIPKQGQTYTVRGTSIGMTVHRQEELVVYLVGIYNPCSNTPPYPERGFNVNRFRPLEELTEEENLALTKPVEEVEQPA